jgi:hypothetical protein
VRRKLTERYRGGLRRHGDRLRQKLSDRVAQVAQARVHSIRKEQGGENLRDRADLEHHLLGRDTLHCDRFARSQVADFTPVDFDRNDASGAEAPCGTVKDRLKRTNGVRGLRDRSECARCGKGDDKQA